MPDVQEPFKIAADVPMDNRLEVANRAARLASTWKFRNMIITDRDTGLDWKYDLTNGLWYRNEGRISLSLMQGDNVFPLVLDFAFRAELILNQGAVHIKTGLPDNQGYITTDFPFDGAANTNYRFKVATGIDYHGIYLKIHQRDVV